MTISAQQALDLVVEAISMEFPDCTATRAVDALARSVEFKRMGVTVAVAASDEHEGIGAPGIPRLFVHPGGTEGYLFNSLSRAIFVAGVCMRGRAELVSKMVQEFVANHEGDVLMAGGGVATPDADHVEPINVDKQYRFYQFMSAAISAPLHLEFPDVEVEATLVTADRFLVTAKLGDIVVQLLIGDSLYAERLGMSYTLRDGHGFMVAFESVTRCLWAASLLLQRKKDQVEAMFDEVRKRSGREHLHSVEVADEWWEKMTKVGNA